MICERRTLELRLCDTRILKNAAKSSTAIYTIADKKNFCITLELPYVIMNSRGADRRPPSRLLHEDSCRSLANWSLPHGRCVQPEVINT